MCVAGGRCGWSCAYEPEQIAHEFGLPGKLFASSDIMLAAKKYKLQVKQVKTSNILNILKVSKS